MLPAEGICILVIDDQRSNVDLLLKILQRAGYVDVQGTTDPHEAIRSAAQRPPDIVLLDLHMPGLGGLEVMDALRATGDWAAPFVVILTGDDAPETRVRAWLNGAKDFIAKPFDVTEVLLRIRNLGDLRRLHKELVNNNRSLEAKVRERTLELEQARLDVIERLGMAAEFRDDATGQHTRRVGRTAGALAHALRLEQDIVTLIERAAPLHDVGKIAIPDHILLKPARLEPAEVEVMRTHTTIGAQLLNSSNSALLDYARDIALTHHERWDGSGYPQGLEGSAIPLAGRIVAVADVYDALTHDRPYRKQRSHTDVMAIITAERGRHFDPEIADAFLEMIGHAK